MSGPVRALLRALRNSARAAGCGAALDHEHERPWVTMTFAGARHTIRATGEHAALVRWIAMLPEADLPIGGWFVASCAAEVAGGEAVIELLVLEE